ncbi:hypothetical protein [Rhodovulum adriaticum]|uniref:Uncharacterized protein n=1 Tax=Rhodovulum adriaticum TaxID=35804 RepID=A0A4R2NL25_RHOAD|nr:hypothetical protein [Rhodovulum adriaticum]MBK1635200.1 hypothetical protein [Rhodovulum adriaticum]TCP22313.1 hypothetical protein EV656_107123 [Rhodovulum adriaticum]
MKPATHGSPVAGSFDLDIPTLNDPDFEKVVEAYRTYLEKKQLFTAKHAKEPHIPGVIPQGYDDPLFDEIARASPAAAQHVARIRKAQDNAAATAFVAALDKAMRR